MTEVDVWVMVDECGQSWASTDEDQLKELAADGDAGLCRRIIKLSLKVPTPEPVEVEVDLPEETSEVKVKVS